MAYGENDLLMLSGVQHIVFCERQWALIHIEKQWRENVSTIEGHFLHEKVDNPFIVEKRKDLIVARSINVVSYKLGLYGVLDVIEFERQETSDNAIKILHRNSFWHPNIVEYKRGKPKNTDCDRVQLCAQAICIEEMHDISLTQGAIFYNKTKHQEIVFFDEDLRNYTISMSQKMHEVYKSGLTPKGEQTASCKNCSLCEICMPNLSKLNASNYIMGKIK